MTTHRQTVEKTILALVVAGLVGCAPGVTNREAFNLIDAELKKATQPGAAASSDTVAAALLPPLRIEIPKAAGPVEERFNVTFNNVPARNFFVSLVTGTRYSMLVHPDVSGTISANLKDVTVIEALDAIRELYGYDYKIEGTRIYIKPLTLQTRVFQVNYLTGNRRGSSDIRVSSGSVSDTGQGSNASPGGQPAPGGSPTTVIPGATSLAINTSKVSTTSTSDFWSELRLSLDGIVGNKEGRSVVISPQSGVVVVRAMWDEMRNVESYLKAMQLSVDRQVILEAKILEVQLNDEYQSGINWAVFRTGDNTRLSAGSLSQGTVLQPTGSLTTGAGDVNQVTRTFSGAPISSLPGQDLVAGAKTGINGMFGLAFQTSNFASLIAFLESQGNVHVLSSPRIATLNNQKAVLKVGQDEFFVTNVSSTTTTGTATTTTPNVTLQPFFSGVSLDVTPQIDDEGNIILHIHPSVVNVTTVEKNINLGNGGSLILPLASSAVSETDSIVRGKDGHVVALGGLMRVAMTNDRAQIPGAGDLPGIGALFGNTKRVAQKRELVILLRPTVVQNDSSWTDDLTESQRRIQSLERKRKQE